MRVLILPFQARPPSCNETFTALYNFRRSSISYFKLPTPKLIFSSNASNELGVCERYMSIVSIQLDQLKFLSPRHTIFYFISHDQVYIIAVRIKLETDRTTLCYVKTYFRTEKNTPIYERFRNSPPLSVIISHSSTGSRSTAWFCHTTLVFRNFFSMSEQQREAITVRPWSHSFLPRIFLFSPCLNIFSIGHHSSIYHT